MASLTISANFGSKERLSQKETVLTSPISQKVLSLFFLCDSQDLDQISRDDGIKQIIKHIGKEMTPAVFYDVGQIPELLDSLRRKVLNSGQTEGKKWLLNLDAKQTHFEFTLPSGTKMSFSKD